MAQAYVVACYQLGMAPMGDKLLTGGLPPGVTCSNTSSSGLNTYLEPVGTTDIGASAPTCASVPDVTDSGGAAAGLLIGGAVFSALAVAFGLRTLRRFIESSAEG